MTQVEPIELACFCHYGDFGKFSVFLNSAALLYHKYIVY